MEEIKHHKYKGLLITAMLLFLTNTSFAQKLTVESLRLAENDLTARTEPRLDANKQPCALLKVQVRDQITEAQGNVVGNVIDKGGEKWIYFTDGTKQTNLLFRNNPPLSIYFPDHGIAALHSKSTYILTVNSEIMDDEYKYSHNDIDALNGQINDLRNRLHGLQGDLDASNARNAQLQRDLNAANARNEQLQRDLDAARRDKSASGYYTQDDIDALNGQINGLRNQLNGLQGDLDAANARNAQLQRDLDSVRKTKP